MSPPVRRRACRSMNVFPRSDAAVSYVPGHPPRASAKAIAGGSSRTTVVPVRRRRSWAWPTRTPRMAVSVRFETMSSDPRGAETARGLFNGCATGGGREFVPPSRGTRPMSNRKVFHMEFHAAILEFGQQVLRRKLLRGEDSRPRDAPREDHDDAGRGGRRGQEPFRGRAPSSVRLPMFHRERGANSALRSVHLCPVDLDDDREGARHRTDERGRLWDQIG